MKPDTKLDAIMRTMPELRHSIPDAEFDIMNSEVCSWMIQQPEVRTWLFNVARERGRIAFNPERRTWRGATSTDTEAIYEYRRKRDRNKNMPAAKEEEL